MIIEVIVSPKVQVLAIAIILKFYSRKIFIYVKKSLKIFFSNQNFLIISFAGLAFLKYLLSKFLDVFYLRISRSLESLTLTIRKHGAFETWNSLISNSLAIECQNVGI